MRSRSAVLLTVVVLLAGCSGFPWVRDAGGDAPSVTPVPPDQVSPQPPPGILSQQVVNPTDLGRAHARAIENESYVLRSNRTVRYANGTIRSLLAVDVAIDENRTFVATVSTEGPEAPVLLGKPPAEAVYWSDGTTYIRRLTREDRTTFVEFDPPEAWIGTWSYWVETVAFGGRSNRPSTFYASLFSAVPTRVENRSMVDGTAVFRLVNEADRPFSDEAFPGPAESVHDVSLVALVDGDGLVRSLELQYAGTIDGESVRVRRTIHYRAVGSTSVDRPSWYGRATSGQSGSGVEAS